MSPTMDRTLPDVMQVCRNGHVITDLLTTFPERALGHCDRCGATTLDHCGTCGTPLSGAVYVPGMVPVGRMEAPHFCATCGAAFPWNSLPAPMSSDPAALLDTLLRRVPRVIRELRSRHGARPAFAVSDVLDLEDLLRALLPIHFDDIRPEARTPSYAAATRTDFLLSKEGIAVVVKRTDSALREARLAGQRSEDIAYYDRQSRVRMMVLFVLDAEARLPDPRQTERAWSEARGALEVRCAIVQ